MDTPDTLTDESIEIKDEVDEVTTETLIPDGDLTLVLGPMGKHHVQVESSFLSTISPVFKAMFESNFREGLALRESNGKSVYIPLPKDCARTMSILLRTLYGADPRTADISPGEILGVAEMADKYQMVNRLVFAKQYWLRNRFEPIPPQDCWNLVLAAYWLDCAEPFNRLSRDLAGCRTSNLKFALGGLDESLGLRLALAVEEFRSRYSSKGRYQSNMGLCLYCFEHAKDGYISRTDGCMFGYFH